MLEVRLLFSCSQWYWPRLQHFFKNMDATRATRDIDNTSLYKLVLFYLEKCIRMKYLLITLIYIRIEHSLLYNL
ncbi:hypothetical protein Hdeb2414_s0018g00520451 [Helianthus debilis subsp. tardiflorus]